MIRRVFIIGSPLSYESNEAFYSGVVSDVSGLETYFMSPTGGGFYGHEIKSLFNPSWAELLNLFKANRCDYATIVFSGHGFTSKNTGEMLLNINLDQQLKISTLLKNKPSPKTLLILDACRNIRDERYFSLLGDIENVPSETFPSYLTVQRARTIFENYVKTTKNGTQVICSSAPGEPSTLTDSGSYFIKSLLYSSRNWSMKVEPQSILLVKGAFRNSVQYIKDYFTPNQNPRLYRSSSMPNYPFAIRHGSELSNPLYYHLL